MSALRAGAKGNSQAPMKNPVLFFMFAAAVLQHFGGVPLPAQQRDPAVESTDSPEPTILQTGALVEGR